ncbi:MAG: hypothetical protein R2713_18725 [Ilumatobacteraceae bacterium]
MSETMVEFTNAAAEVAVRRGAQGLERDAGGQQRVLQHVAERRTHRPPSPRSGTAPRRRRR